MGIGLALGVGLGVTEAVTDVAVPVAVDTGIELTDAGTAAGTAATQASSKAFEAQDFQSQFPTQLSSKASEPAAQDAGEEAAQKAAEQAVSNAPAGTLTAGGITGSAGGLGAFAPIYNTNNGSVNVTASANSAGGADASSAEAGLVLNDATINAQVNTIVGTNASLSVQGSTKATITLSIINNEIAYVVKLIHGFEGVDETNIAIQILTAIQTCLAHENSNVLSWSKTFSKLSGTGQSASDMNIGENFRSTVNKDICTFLDNFLPLMNEVVVAANDKTNPNPVENIGVAATNAGNSFVAYANDYYTDLSGLSSPVLTSAGIDLHLGQLQTDISAVQAATQ